ncbi:hypothetical protein IW261DRAFT_985867 [Armillaria novae-zelandiae]|uniref:Uncharacterized protein n=1 Tax=Armillaria novae-zelandiae TaxID=153914 RepID=A0AA39UEG8_9AGAR|nr:hypothetical protein IW261DRAFT_985867 [Armillaria novae-zelandiae]
MFEERCLTCGSHLQDDGSAYCSDECQTLDSASPSISSASSAYSSPSLGYAVGGDVPALIPSVLGTALRNFQQDRHSVSSSSASSTAWSVVTDDDDEEDPILGTGSDPDSAAESIYESTSKSSTSHGLVPRPLSYARRPSGTNTRSTVPRLHSRTSSSGSFSGHVRGLRSATSHPHTVHDDDVLIDSGFPSREVEDYLEQIIPQSAPERQHNQFAREQDHSTITKTRRSRNRSSLPAYYSLLPVPGTQNSFPICQASSKRASPTISNSSGQTVVKPSPPTPKVSLGLPPFVSPRGRRRDLGTSQSSSRSDDSFSCSSRSTSDSREDPSLAHSPPRETRFLPRPRLDSRGNKESVLDCSSVPDPRRGRAAVRRNSSPPPKMTAPMFVFEGRDHYRDNTARPHARGRARVEELDGVGGSEDAPGLGYGRSGLIDRERGHRTGGRFRS